MTDNYLIADIADEVRAAAELLHAAARQTTTCDPTDQQTVTLTPAQALEEAREAGWWATHTDILCTDHDEEHLAKARELATAFAARYAIDGEGWDEFLAWCPETWRKQLEELRPLPPFAAAMPGETDLTAAAG